LQLLVLLLKLLHLLLHLLHLLRGYVLLLCVLLPFDSECGRNGGVLEDGGRDWHTGLECGWNESF
jgi:hypothetical protein